MKQVIKDITAKFTTLLKTNNMLAVEILFRFSSREVKDQILHNYDMGGARPVRVQNERQNDEAQVDLNNFDHMANELNIDNLRIDDDN